MKKHYQKYCRHLAYAIISTSSFLFTTKTFSQETFTITPELSKKVVETYKLESFKIYPVTLQEVDYKTFDTAQVLTTGYKRQQHRLEQYKSAYDEYNNALKANSEKQDAIKIISQNIDTFLSSDEKYEIKEKLLIDSQALADKYGIKVLVDDNRIKLQSILTTPDTKNNTATTPQRQILIYEKDKRANKNDLRTFKFEISHYNIVEPEKTHNYRMYLEVSKEILQVPKTETGKVLSDKIIKKSVYVIKENPVDISILSGDFIELPEKHSLITNDVAYKFMKNELITQSNEHYNQHEEFIGFPIIKKSGTDELYYIMSNQFILQLTGVVERAKFQNLGNTSEYKMWKSKYLALLQSAQTNVNSCNAIIGKHTYLNRIGQKKYDTNTFTKQEKSSFNQNLDSLNDKLKQIGELENQRDNLSFYNNKASIEESVKSYNLSTYYNTTSRCY
nr:hypothetical protein [uncultured Flavobacterium sp.]